MVVSQNGWPADPDPAVIGIVPLTVDGVTIGDGVRGGDVATVFAHLLHQIHTRVQPLQDGWCWGYKYRPIAGSTVVSNHASGTAVDVNAPVHPQGVAGTFLPAQVAELRAVLAVYGGAVRWGGDYRAPAVVDEMHFEINTDPARLAQVVAQLGAPMQIVDYSSDSPGAAAVAAKGYGGALRYLPKEGGSTVKPITPKELRDYWDNGLDVALIGEHRDPARPLQGAPAGAHDAAYFLGQARAITLAAGRPAEAVRAIYLTCDVDTVASNRPAAGEYYRAAQTILQDATGIYGEYDLIDFLVGLGVGRWFWQTFAWSIGHNLDTQSRHPAAHLFQRRETVMIGTTQCDVNDVLKPDYGQYGGSDDMTPEQERWLFNLDAVNGALAEGRATVVLQVSDGKTVAPKEYPITNWKVPVDAAALAAAMAAPVAAELVKLGVAGVTGEAVARAFDAAAKSLHGTSL